MRTRILGKTKLEVSQLGFGCMRLPVSGPDPSYIDEEQTAKMLQSAIDAGCNYVDTAWAYHGGQGRNNPGASEPVVGRILAEKGLREKVTLVTKLPSWVLADRDQMDKILDEQLKRLQTNYLDIYLVHNLNRGNWERLKEMRLYQFLDAARKDGRIKHVGFSFHDRYNAFADIINDYDWEVAQIQYNYLDRYYQAGEKGLHLAAQKNIGVVIMEPLRGGFLINHLPQEFSDKLKAVRPNWSLVDWGLRWLWNQKEPNTVLSGMSSMAQVEENMAIAQSAVPHDFTAEDKAVIDEVYLAFKERIKVGCTSCGYCLPCQAGVSIPKIFSFYNDYYLIDNDEVRTRAKFYYGAQTLEGERAKKCNRCGKCVEKCPQQLSIPDLMAKAAKLFDE